MKQEILRLLLSSDSYSPRPLHRYCQFNSWEGNFSLSSSVIILAKENESQSHSHTPVLHFHYFINDKRITTSSLAYVIVLNKMCGSCEERKIETFSFHELAKDLYLIVHEEGQKQQKRETDFLLSGLHHHNRALWDCLVQKRNHAANLLFQWAHCGWTIITLCRT